MGAGNVADLQLPWGLVLRQGHKLLLSGISLSLGRQAPSSLRVTQNLAPLWPHLSELWSPLHLLYPWLRNNRDIRGSRRMSLWRLIIVIWMCWAHVFWVQFHRPWALAGIFVKVIDSGCSQEKRSVGGLTKQEKKYKQGSSLSWSLASALIPWGAPEYEVYHGAGPP